MKHIHSGIRPILHAVVIRSHVRVILLLVCAVALIFSCSDDDKSPTSTGKRNNVNNNIIFAYDQSPELPMGSSRAICCGPWEEGYDDRLALKIFFYDPDFEESFWKLFIAVDDVTVDSTYTLPSTGAPFQLFSIDANTSNELSSNTMDSSGEITIDQLECGPPLKISFTIDAVIGSEYGNMPAINVTGSFSCTIYTNSAPFGCDFSM
jgi:hypothetical protein